MCIEQCLRARWEEGPKYEAPCECGPTSGPIVPKLDTHECSLQSIAQEVDAVTALALTLADAAIALEVAREVDATTMTCTGLFIHPCPYFGAQLYLLLLLSFTSAGCMETNSRDLVQPKLRFAIFLCCLSPKKVKARYRSISGKKLSRAFWQRCRTKI